MDNERAKSLLKETFENSFDSGNFIRFINEMFNKFDYQKIDAEQEEIPKDFQEFVESYSLLGRYKDRENNLIEVLTIKLKRGNPESARTMQRNFVAKYLEHRNANAALVAFYGDDVDNWRFSFVKLEYHLEKDETGNVKPSKSLTPPKRYSFFVGKTEPSHTAQSRFLELLMKEDLTPTVLEIESAFSIEKVTKEFFEEYKKLFLELEESLTNIVNKNENLEKEFNEKEISTSDFAKKLLGQIVFIYFLQKKGWMGIEKDETGKFKEWGSGPKDFLKKLYNKEIVTYNNFFNDILEPLFYEALSRDRSMDNDYYDKFKCKIPFLNGGLFEPTGGYNWDSNDILLDNKIFGEIIKTFDLYNFTVKEDEPLEKEVAIDPEMLGKIFENLLDIKDRKSKGSYYTPREIVYYMCQESLINYLVVNTKIDKKDIEDFIHNGDLSIQIITNKERIDQLLRDVKVADPAIGSGAFLVGMMMEIVKARNSLTKLFSKEEQDERTSYNFKRMCIEDNLYGVDIDSGAVDIAQLRLWLSLIVDETDIHKIKPLPNLDYKIMCGNSLMDEFEGVKLFDEQLLGEIKKEDYSEEIRNIEKDIEKLYEELGMINTGKKKDYGRSNEIKREIDKLKKKKQKLEATPQKEGAYGSLFEVQRIKESQKKLKQLQALHKQFFNEHNRRNKIELRAEIEKKDWEFIEETLKEQGNESAKKKFEQIKRTRSKPFFLWKLYFSEVFQENDGFDVVIANPPYEGEKGHKDIFRPIAQTEFGKRFYYGKIDLFYLFFHKSIDLCKPNSQISFITTNYYLTATNAKKLRQDLKDRTIIIKLVNFNELKIFESALGQHNMITILEKGQNKYSIAQTCITQRQGIATPEVLEKILYTKDKKTHYFNIAQKDLYEGNELYIRIMGHSENHTNRFQKILEKIEENKNYLSNICDIKTGIQSGADKINNEHIKDYQINANINDGIFVLNTSEINKLNLLEKDKSILKPWFKNSDIKKWFTNNKTEKYIIYAEKRKQNLEGNKLKNHLLKFKNILDNSSDNSPYLHRPRSINFNGPKIVVPQRSPSNIFGYNDLPWYASADVYFITSKDNSFSLKYILALLNSKLYYVWLYYKGKRKGEMLELYKTPLSEIPIKKVEQKDQKPFIELVDKILSITKDENYLNKFEKQIEVNKLEDKINYLVYRLFDLTEEEIKLIEDFTRNK